MTRSSPPAEPLSSQGQAPAVALSERLREDNGGMPGDWAQPTASQRGAQLTFVASILLFLAGLGLLVAVGELHWSTAVFFTVELAFPATGYLIVLRTRNRVGWVFLWAGLGLGLQAFCAGYAEYALVVRPGSLPAARFLAWLGEIIWLPQLLMATMFLFLLFPDGRVPSPRWRWVVRLGVAGALVVEAGVALEPRLYSYPKIQAPFGGLISQSSLDIISTVGSLALLPAMLLALVSLFARYRRAGQVARLQIKWFLYAAVAFLAAQLASNVFELAQDNGLVSIVGGLSTLFIPVAVAIAVLKHRLYDIDFIINRTLLWTSLTVTLSAVYLVAVTVLQGAINPLAGESPLSVAVSTLATAALFGPARTRIQAFIDRRFYRNRYDARQTIEAFATRLRDEVDLDALSAELVAVTRRVMQPTHASLWLREPPGKAST